MAITTPAIEIGQGKTQTKPIDLGKLAPYVYLAPALLFLLAFIYWPIAHSLILSFQEWDFLRPDRPFVGLDNYRDLLADDEFLNAMAVTCWFVLLSVPLRLALALLAAHALLGERPLDRILRGGFFMPVITSGVAVAIVWSWLFNTDQGLINLVLAALGLGKVSWLSSTDMALVSIVIVNIWKQLGYDLVIYIAGLQAIPRDYYEAAAIDGADRWMRFRTITLPLLMPTTFFLLVVSVIDSFQVFTLVNVMTEGGPAWSTDLIVNLLYRMSFVYFEIGKGAALAMLLFALLMLLTAFKFWAVGRRVYYEYQ